MTTKRLVRLIQNLGMQARGVDAVSELGNPDLLIALHATRGLAASRAFKQKNPSGKLLVYITGTDIYSPDGLSAELIESLSMADRVLVSQLATLQSIPEEFKGKTTLIPTSVDSPELPSQSPVAELAGPRLGFVGHLREVKNPFLMNRALEQTQGASSAVSIGAALETGFADTAWLWEKRNPRFQWLGNLPYPEALACVRDLDYTINSSFSEGGSNAIAESIVLGTPVLATRIEGNLGLLGDEYLGLYKSDNAEELAALIQRVMDDQGFASELQAQTKDLAEHFSPQREQEALASVL